MTAGGKRAGAGRPTIKHRRKTAAFALKPDVLRAIAETAIAEQMSKSRVVEKILERWFFAD